MKDMILILNYSDEFAIEAMNRLRGEQVYAEIINGMTTAAQIREIDPKGIVLCGEAASAKGVLDAQVLELGIPVLALGHAAHMALAAMGGACAGTAIVGKKAPVSYGSSPLFSGMTADERYFKEALTLMLPGDVRDIASAAGCTIAFEHPVKKIYGAQFELERNDPQGTQILKNFAMNICGCKPWWTLEMMLDEAQRQLNEAAAQGGRAVCAVSGGVDSTVAALMTLRAFGDRMTAVYLETGLMREGEGQFIKDQMEALGIPLLSIDRSGLVLDVLANKQSMKEKRRVVTECLHEEMIRQTAAMPDAKTLVLGTHYNDMLIAGQHSVGWNDENLSILEPLAKLQKKEVRAIGKRLGLSDEICDRKPFPALGLGARLVGEVTSERLEALRRADSIFEEEIRQAGLEKKLFKFFPVLTGSDPVTNSEMMILRAVTLSGTMLMPARLPYDLVERTVERIRREAPSVARIFYDETPTPVGQETFT